MAVKGSEGQQIERINFKPKARVVESRDTYRRQNKRLDVKGEPMDNVKKNDENVEENKPTNNPELSTTRSSKSIEQTKQENGDKTLKEIIRKTPKRAETDTTVGKPGIPPNMRRNNEGSQKRRNNNGQNGRRNKNRKQNIKQKNENTTKNPNCSQRLHGVIAPAPR